LFDDINYAEDTLPLQIKELVALCFKCL